MSCLCIGGVCIPYSAILPLLLLGLQWIVAHLTKIGLLPDWLGKKLGVNSIGNSLQSTENCSNKCCVNNSDSTTTSIMTCTESEINEKRGLVEHIESMNRWLEVVESNKNSTLIVKFTADWCKPCKQIQPYYATLASKYGDKITFVTLDVDGDDCDALLSRLKISVMPTFVCLRKELEVGRMSGGNNEDKLIEWVSEMCS